jgi:hypothetical protein
VRDMLDHTGTRVSRCIQVGIDAYEEAQGDDGRVVSLNAPCTTHGVEQVAIHSQGASQGTGVDHVREWTVSVMVKW